MGIRDRAFDFAFFIPDKIVFGLFKCVGDHQGGSGSKQAAPAMAAAIAGVIVFLPIHIVSIIIGGIIGGVYGTCEKFCVKPKK